MSSHSAHNSHAPRLGNNRHKEDSKLTKLRRKIADRSRRTQRIRENGK